MCEPWPIEWVCGEPSGVTPEQLLVAQNVAQRILWGRTGRRLGLCTATETYRPRTGICGPITPYLDRQGFWHNGRKGCDCTLTLRRSPLHAVTSVLLGGQPFTDYVVQGNRLRHREGCWPSVPDCDDAIIEITYEWGIPLRPASVDPPRPEDELYSMAAASMGEVTTEVVKGMCGQPCKLPGRAIAITRQNVTVQMSSTDELADKGFLGLPISDELIRLTNPKGLKSRSRVYSPDMPRVY